VLEEAFEALAMAGGTAVVQAAGTDAWAGFRARVARLLSRGDSQRESAELERLTLTAEILKKAGPTDLERVRMRQEASWQVRFEMLMESLAEAERDQAAAELRHLIQSAGTPGLSVAGNLNVQPGNGSVGAAIIHGTAIGQYYEAPSPATHREARESREQQEQNRRSALRDAAYRRLLETFPRNTDFDTVEWVRQAPSSNWLIQVLDPWEIAPAGPAYYLMDVRRTLSTIKDSISSPAKLDHLAAYLATLSFSKAKKIPPPDHQYDTLVSAYQVDSYMEAVRRCLRTYFQQLGEG
jgi:hypothetical protein